jgi:hypothetical protein
LLQESDFAIFPTLESEQQSAKSSNRLTQSMACGLPAIVGPRPSYRAIAAACPSVLEASDDDSFMKALEIMSDATNRRHAALHVHEYALALHSPEAVTQDWIRHLGIHRGDPYGQKSLVSLNKGIGVGKVLWSLRQRLDPIIRRLPCKPPGVPIKGEA